jgi:hypothetical protein
VSRSSRQALALLPLVLAFTLTACGLLSGPPVPDGEPTVPRPARAAATWTGVRGGTPELEPDGTIAAGDICGTPDHDADRNVVRPGAGTWIVLDHRRQTVVQVSFGSSDAFTGHLGSFVWIRPDQGAGSGAVHRKAEEGVNAERCRLTTTPRGGTPGRSLGECGARAREPGLIQTRGPR